MKNNFYFIFIFLVTQITLNAQDLRISVDELSKNITAYKIIDVRNYEDFSITHIKNSINFPVSKSYENKKVDGKIVKPNKMQALVRELGLNIEDNIVIYDDGVFYDASRIFWTLEVYGFKNVKLLNGGFDTWEKKNFLVSSETLKVKPSKYIASINNNRLSTKFTTQIATKNPNQTVIDARGYESYIGKESVAKRFGHIPNAIHIPAYYNLKKENKLSKLKEATTLKELYKDVNKDKKVIIYCKIGRVASTNYFALRELGYNVSNYDASWREWGNDISLPIINRSKAQK
ncbi:sulfurtransferase [Poseidonibacter ostreae]|jgi:thiosulfate/3-mercaptopyruvate sulfurtransferase|uniref:Sulfurtransferase n=1 Tax=Poseidonibacter ostreae TaxID=2654171 RepID=A0A6L4WUA0_9BACT|nr:rhodanese-like domain-containing protein [Poseidonibacter ostreae]KAB7884680.1 sulfurtransferase [Poseidonibacter ostreae]KAB7889971.1 sulfurtransferase [Poseidonibacter ostreae]KAB7891485.1 sulfurtransferase [Poseidonibacter ostreae]